MRADKRKNRDLYRAAAQRALERPENQSLQGRVTGYGGVHEDVDGEGAYVEIQMWVPRAALEQDNA